MKAPAIKASCSVTPAARPIASCRPPSNTAMPFSSSWPRRANPEGAAARPDAKSQVTVRYENGKPVEVPQIVVSTQHLDPKLESKHVRDIIEPYVRKALPDGWLTQSTV